MKNNPSDGKKNQDQLFSDKKTKTSLCHYYPQKSIGGEILEAEYYFKVEFRFKHTCYLTKQRT